jgi:hypothetical protein
VGNGVRDFGYEAQKAAEAHLAACQEAYWELEDGEMSGEESDSPAVGPFCNCDTCIVREVLHAAWPFLLEAAKQELADSVGAEAEDQEERHGDGREHHVLEGEVHQLTIPLCSDDEPLLPDRDPPLGIRGSSPRAPG